MQVHVMCTHELSKVVVQDKEHLILVENYVLRNPLIDDLAKLLSFFFNKTFFFI